MLTLSIIVPVYNEKNTISALLQEIRSVTLPAGIHKEIVIVDDCSTDGTREKLQEFSSHPEIRIFLLERNQGKTAAVRSGIEKSIGDIVLIQDADLEYSPGYYPRLLKPILNGTSEVVYGSRFKGNIKKMEPMVRLANIFSNLTVNILYGAQLSDVNTCFKVFKKEVLKNMTITSANFSFEAEITAKLLKKGYSIQEVPIDYVARSKKSGKKMNWRTALEMYFALFQYRFGRE